MKFRSIASILSLSAWFVLDPCQASSFGPALIEQPINLGPKSDPGRIPLGDIAVICNYDYGLHSHIGDSRPCPAGAMRWEDGTELDQNLASVFGIAVEVQDATQVRQFPVILRMKAWKAPSYSPYTKEQVLAATLWCLLRSVGGTPEHPLEVQVIAEGLADKRLEDRLSGDYTTSPSSHGKDMPAAQVPGTVIVEDSRGIAWVVFPEVTRKPTSPPPTPSVTILESGGESDAGWYLLPEWGNGGEANKESPHSVTFSYPRKRQETLAAEIFAQVISTLPTESQPLKITIWLEEDELASYPAFRSAPGWKESRHDPRKVLLDCELVWDAVARKLTKGSIPLVELAESGHFISPVQEVAALPSDAERLSNVVRERIQNRIHDGSLVAEKNMTSEMLADSGLKRQIGLAGYYEALATFYQNHEGNDVSDKPAKSTAQFKNPQLDRLYRIGWNVGMNRGHAIVIETRREIEAARAKE